MRIGVAPGLSVVHPARNLLLKGLENPAEKEPLIREALAEWLDRIGPDKGVFSLKKFGAKLDGIQDDTQAVLDAIDEINSLVDVGTSYDRQSFMLTSGGLPIKTTGVIQSKPGVIFNNFGATWKFTTINDGLILTHNNFIEHTTLSALGISGYVGDMLGISDNKGFIRQENKFCGGGLGVRLEGPGNGLSASGTGLKLLGDSVATGYGLTNIVFEDLRYYNLDRGIWIRGERSWVNSGKIKSIGYGCKRFITVDKNIANSNNETSAWTMEYQIQPNTDVAIAQYAVYDDGLHNRWFGTTWDWHVSGTPYAILFGPRAKAYYMVEMVASNYIKEAATDGENGGRIITLSGAYREPQRDPMVPYTTENSSFTGADNALVFADQNFTVTNTGTNLFTNLSNAFRQGDVAATIAALTDSTILIDLGAVKNYFFGAGVLFGFGSIASRVKIGFSSDNVSYTTIIDQSSNTHYEVARIGKSFLGNARYLKFEFIGTGEAVNLQSIFGFFASLQGTSFLSKDSPNHRTPAVMFNKLAADRALADVNTVQTWFDSGSDEITLAPGTYEIEAEFSIDRVAGTNAHTLGISFGGTRVLNSMMLMVTTSQPSANGLASSISERCIRTASNVTVTQSNSAADETINLKMRGTLRVQTGGTFIPQLTYSAAPGGTPTMKKDSSFRIWPVGDTTSLATVGRWS